LILGEYLSPESIYWLAGHRGQKRQIKRQEKFGPAQDDGEPTIDPCCCNLPIFRPGQQFFFVQDSFIREMIHPTIKDYVSPGEVYFIEVFNFINATFLLPTAEIFQWIGIWELLNNWLTWEDAPAREGVYMGVGFFLLIISYKVIGWESGWIDVEDSWKFGMSKTFGWRRKTKNFGRETFSFCGFVLVWVGASLYWDQNQEDVLVYIIYAFLSIVLLLVFGELFSVDSLFFVDTKMTLRDGKIRGKEEDVIPSIELRQQAADVVSAADINTIVTNV